MKIDLLSQPLLKRVSTMTLLFNFPLLCCRVKDGKEGVLDTDTYIVVWTTTPLPLRPRGLTVGSEY